MVRIKSNPAPHFVQWSMKDKKSGTLQQINVNDDEYRGTSYSFPRPLLVVKHKETLKNYSFRIEVQNVIGYTEKVMPGNICKNGVISLLLQNFLIHQYNRHLILTVLKMIKPQLD